MIIGAFAFDLGNDNGVSEDNGASEEKGGVGDKGVSENNKVSENKGMASLAAAMRLELFTNGKWRPVNLQPSAQGSSLICADPSIGDLKASKLRLTNVSGKALAVGFKRFEAKIL